MAQTLVAVVHNLESASSQHLLLWQLSANPLECLLTADAVATHHSTNAELKRSCDTNDGIETDALVEPAVEEYGTFQPVHARVHEVACHSRMDDVVDRLFVLLALEQKGCKDTLLQDVAFIDLVTDESTERLADGRRCSHQSLGSGIAVVDANATQFQQTAYIALACSYSTGYCDIHAISAQ